MKGTAHKKGKRKESKRKGDNREKVSHAAANQFKLQIR